MTRAAGGIAAAGAPEPASASVVLETIAALLAPSGLACRGGFNFRPGDAAPAGPSGDPAKAVLLVGNLGAAYWPSFEAWRRTTPAQADPLDAWSRAVIAGVAQQVGARAVMPSDRPFQPFQRWAARAEGLRASPLGLLMHPDCGLWHAYRGALLFDRAMDWPERESPPHACDGCEAKPCLRACPVDAHTPSGFAYADCLAWVRGAGGGGCRARGCGDRNACPVGAAFRYPAAAQAFHMAAFARG